jgi:adenosylcobyric acid synthase
VPVVLVGDIDRGGVIASLVGTHTILPEQDRNQIVGYIINKFRGDVTLFDDGIAAIDAFTGWPCFGVVPWLKAAGRLPAEDSVVLERLVKGNGGALKIAVPVLSRIANFDDLDPLAAEPEVDLVFIRAGDRLPADAGLVVLPGSKSTIADLEEFRAHGWDRELHMHVRRGGRVIGICGGYQMLGRSVADPLGLEGAPRTVEGLGLLDVDTVMAAEKTVRNTRAQSLEHDVPLSGYEIHLGVTEGPDTLRAPIAIDGRSDGASSADRMVMGTYLHGLFSSDGYRRKLLESFGIEGGGRSYRAMVDEALDELASELEQRLSGDWLGRLLR